MSEYDGIQSAYTTTFIKQDGSNTASPPDTVPETAGLSYTEADFGALSLKNPDTAGWIAIPGTVVNYPVVWFSDNEKYLDTSFEGKHSSAGAIFADKDNTMYPLDTNTILYGHNMGKGRQDMFGSLLAYKEYEYYAAHRYIQFDTVYERHGWWKVFAVVMYDVRDKNFPFPQTSFSDAAAFAEWQEKITAYSFHGADTDISPGARILTLSTCDRSQYRRYGRLLILAVKIDKED
ncbi:MAG: class B sortase [Clostridiales bacterium]|jgi:sortase B|nr:class B sortase [Clostridiales bacterium]